MAQAHAFRQSHRAVSPVVGVVLLVGVAVLLAAVVAVGALNLANSTTPDENPIEEATPDAEFSFLANDGDLLIEHTGGDEIDADKLVIQGAVADAPVTWAEAGTVAEGDSRVLETDGSGTVTVAWETQTGETEVLAESEM